MFHFLHRCVQGCLLLLLAAAFWLVWEQRERGRPILDLYLAWDSAGYRLPDPLPHSRGTVARAVSENIVEFRDREGRIWNVGLSGLGGVAGDGRDPWRTRFASDTRTNLSNLLVGRVVEMAWVSANPDRTGLGFAYLGTNSESVAIRLVEDGRLRWRAEDSRLLPLLEQMKLRGADRRARTEKRGMWDPGLHIAANP